jgi:hypothetical protein
MFWVITQSYLVTFLHFSLILEGNNLSTLFKLPKDIVYPPFKMAMTAAQPLSGPTLKQLFMGTVSTSRDVVKIVSNLIEKLVKDLNHNTRPFT